MRFRLAAEPMQVSFDLQGELACRRKDQGTRGETVRRRQFASQTLQHG